MKYILNKTNHCTFKSFEEGRLAPRAYCIPHSKLKAAKAADYKTERYNSDMVTILTNVLDNAIDAVQKCDEKKIIIKIIKDKEMLIIDSSNPYVGQISDGETLKTTKQDKDNHGYGIANIRQTVEANSGSCFIETQNGIFHITIAIPLT